MNKLVLDDRTDGVKTYKGDQTWEDWRWYLFVDGAVVIGGGDVVVLRVKKSLLVFQQLCQDSADGLLVSMVLSFSWQAARRREEKKGKLCCYFVALQRIKSKNSSGVLLEDVGAEHSSQGSGVPALLLEGSHTGQEAAQEAQEAVVQLGKLLQEVLEVSTQLLVIAVIWGISTLETVTKHSQASLRKQKLTKKKQKQNKKNPKHQASNDVVLNQRKKVLLCSAGT